MHISELIHSSMNHVLRFSVIKNSSAWCMRYLSCVCVFDVVRILMHRVIAFFFFFF